MTRPDEEGPGDEAESRSSPTPPASPGGAAGDAPADPNATLIVPGGLALPGGLDASRSGGSEDARQGEPATPPPPSPDPNATVVAPGGLNPPPAPLSQSSPTIAEAGGSPIPPADPRVPRAVPGAATPGPGGLPASQASPAEGPTVVAPGGIAPTGPGAAPTPPPAHHETLRQPAIFSTAQHPVTPPGGPSAPAPHSPAPGAPPSGPAAPPPYQPAPGTPPAGPVASPPYQPVSGTGPGAPPIPPSYPPAPGAPSAGPSAAPPPYPPTPRAAPAGPQMPPPYSPAPGPYQPPATPNWAPQVQPATGPAALGPGGAVFSQRLATASKGILFHLGRAWTWNLSAARVTPQESEALAAQGVTNSTAQRYLAWRRSAMIVTLLPLLLTAALTIPDVSDVATDGLTPLGVFVAYAPSIVLLALPVLTAFALVLWKDVRSSQRLLLGTWLAATIVPVVLALAPPGWLVDTSGMGTADRAVALFTVGVILAFNYAISLVPTIISIPSGVMRGCLRVKALLPESVIPGWFLVAVAPFYSLLSIIAFIMVIQLAGSAVLVLGIGLMAFAPWLSVIYARSYVRPLTTEDEINSLVRQQRIGSVLSAASLLFLVIWAFTVEIPSGGGKFTHLLGLDSDTSLLRPWDLILRVVEFFSRSILASVVFAHIFLQVNRANWRSSREFQATPSAAEYDQVMADLDAVLAESS